MATHDDMIADIEHGFRNTARYTGRETARPEVIEAMRRAPRDAFVRAVDSEEAFENRPLSIGHGQTISQPFIVALMVELCDITPGARVLEVGTGSGYAAAVLGEIASAVYSVETVSALADDASGRLARLGYENVHVRHGDGAAGWPEHAPYDAIIVSAAARETPGALQDQLRAPGVMVVPVGKPWREQQLVRVVKDADGGISSTPVLPVAFVPLV